MRILTVLLLFPALNNLASAQRLPTSVIPSHYKLWIDPSIEKQQFSGEETIDVRLRERPLPVALLRRCGFELHAPAGLGYRD